jgi:hypothetical protein
MGKRGREGTVVLSRSLYFCSALGNQILRANPFPSNVLLLAFLLPASAAESVFIFPARKECKRAKYQTAGSLGWISLSEVF